MANRYAPDVRVRMVLEHQSSYEMKAAKMGVGKTWGLSAADAVVESIFLPIEIEAPPLESADPAPACDAEDHLAGFRHVAQLYGQVQQPSLVLDDFFRSIQQ